MLAARPGRRASRQKCLATTVAAIDEQRARRAPSAATRVAGRGIGRVDDDDVPWPLGGRRGSRVAHARASARTTVARSAAGPARLAMTARGAGVALDEGRAPAPRLRASMPPAPLPANRSRKRDPWQVRLQDAANNVCLTRSASGARARAGARMLRAVPAMTRPASRVPADDACRRRPASRPHRPPAATAPTGCTSRERATPPPARRPLRGGAASRAGAPWRAGRGRDVRRRRGRRPRPAGAGLLRALRDWIAPGQ